MNVIFFKNQVQPVLRSVFDNYPMCTNCIHFSSKDGSFYCNKFKVFSIMARFDEKKCGLKGKYFKFKEDQK